MKRNVILNPIKRYLECYKKAFVINDKASKEEYWNFTIVNISVLTVLFIIPIIYGEKYLVFLFFYGALSFIPSISVSIRRIHESGGSLNWWLLSLLYPVIKGVSKTQNMNEIGILETFFYAILITLSIISPLFFLINEVKQREERERKSNKRLFILLGILFLLFLPALISLFK